MEILRVENIKKSYGSGDNAVKALDGVSLSVNRGDFLAIVGPSGSGKSTLLHILGGIDTPTSGRVFINGKDIYTTQIGKRRVGKECRSRWSPYH